MIGRATRAKCSSSLQYSSSPKTLNLQGSTSNLGIAWKIRTVRRLTHRQPGSELVPQEPEPRHHQLLPHALAVP